MLLLIPRKEASTTTPTEPSNSLSPSSYQGPIQKSAFAENQDQAVAFKETEIPQGLEEFLETDYAALSHWLDERFEVDFKNMTPELIFDQVPLNDIYYELHFLPENAPAFNFEDVNISRRELLKEIADHWSLDMSYVMGNNDEPSAVRVIGLDSL
ncbi:MAG: hypothetical protein AAGA96_06375 [Verrucomicrobiota bacterium]